MINFVLSTVLKVEPMIELFSTTSSTIAEAPLGYLDSQGVNGYAVILLWYIRLGHNDET